jgi:RND superfamily putative drug exporter
MKVNLSTEALARASAKKPWVAIAVWLVVLVGAYAVMNLLSGSLSNNNDMTNNPEYKKGSDILTARLGSSDKIDETVIIHSDTLTVDDPAFKTQVETMLADMTALGPTVVLSGADYYQTKQETMVSADRHSTLIAISMPLDGDKHVAPLYQIEDKVTAGGVFKVYQTGNASFNSDAVTLAENTMQTGETIGIAVALIVLAIVFGALAAAFLPIVLGLIAIVIAMGLTFIVGHYMDISFTVNEMIMMMGLAVGIDYSLFILTRFREERRRGLNKIDAIAATGATASRAVFVSGLTVLLALASLVLFPMTIFHSMGIGAMLVVFVSILATLTLLPAFLSLLGDKVNALRIPFLPKETMSAKGPAADGFWVKTTRLVTKRPVISVLLVIIILVAALIPFFDKKTGMAGISSLPDSLRAKQGYNFLQQEFHIGMSSPAVVVIDGNVTTDAAKAAVTALQQSVATNKEFAYTQVVPYPDKNLEVVYLSLANDDLSEAAMDAVVQLRSDYIPAAFKNTGLNVYVTGQTAGVLDFNSTTSTYTPIVFVFVLSLSFVILLLAFRSIVIPATAIVMNLLSVGAAYGLLVLVFQKGIGAALFGFQKVDVIESWLPLFLFAVLFGLSMDYHVFLLSRIREHYQKTGNNAAAVSFGLSSTGKLITGAALIMVAVFGGFALGKMSMFQEMGFGLGVAVLLDATLVRTVLVPAVMEILGKYNWYFPKWLEWLPNVSLGENTAPQPPKTAPPASKQAGNIPLKRSPLDMDSK